MVCSECGHENHEDVAFCVNCGNDFSKKNDNKANTEKNYVLKGIRDIASSPLFLFAIITFCVSIVLKVVYNSIGYNYFVSTLYKVARDLKMEQELYGFIYKIPTRSVIAAVFGQSLSIVMVIGLFITYVSAKQKKGDMKTGGLDILRIVVTVYEILLIAAAVVLVIASVIIIGFLYNRNNRIIDGYFITRLILIGLSVLALSAVLAIAAVFFSKARKSIDLAKQGLLFGRADLKASSFVGVMCYIIAAALCFAIPGGAILDGISKFAAAIAYLLFGIVLFRYNTAQKIGFAPIFEPVFINTETETSKPEKTED